MPGKMAQSSALGSQEVAVVTWLVLDLGPLRAGTGPEVVNNFAIPAWPQWQHYQKYLELQNEALQAQVRPGNQQTSPRPVFLGKFITSLGEPTHSDRHCPSSVRLVHNGSKVKKQKNWINNDTLRTRAGGSIKRIRDDQLWWARGWNKIPTLRVGVAWRD